MNMIANVIVTN